MVNEFAVGFRSTEDQVDALLVLALSADGAGAALFLLSALFGFPAGAATGLALVCIAAGAMFAHLGHPTRFWRVLSRSTKAWISRGAVFTAGLVVLGALSLAMPGAGMAGAGTAGAGVLALLLRAAALFCALVVMVYTGLLYSSMSSVPLWRSPLLPVLFPLHSLASGATLLLAFTAIAATGVSVAATAAVMALLALSLMLTWLFTSRTATSAAAQESLRRLHEGPLRPLYVSGALVAGLVGPLVLIAVALLVSAGAHGAAGAEGASQGLGGLIALLLVAAAALRLAGDLGFRSAVLRAGVHEPVI